MMLTHMLPSPRKPSRAVIVGARGFVAGATLHALQSAGVETLAITRNDVDLTAADAGSQLATLLRPGDTIVFAAAKAPARNADDVVANLRQGQAVVDSVTAVRPGHIIYISSDAVYSDLPIPLTEASPPAPSSLHGIMHRAREIMLSDAAGDTPLCFVRPTLIYGVADPHNGYGPNRFARQIAAGENVTLFGEGEERRDHIAIEDVAEIVKRVIFHRSHGIVNAASGQVLTFRAIAEMLAQKPGYNGRIIGTPRSGPMPHGGYRPFDIGTVRSAFPDFKITQPESGIRHMIGISA